MTKYNNKGNVIGFLATGRLGRIIMESLLKNNFNVTITTRDKSQKKLQSLMKSGASIVEINFREIDEFIHLIKENSNIYIGNIYQIEIIKKIIELIINSKKKINKLVFIGGANTIKISEAYGKLDKLEDEIMSKLPKSIIIKPAMIFGMKDDNNIEKTIKWLKKFPIFPIIGSGKTLYQPIHYFDLRDIVTKVFKKNNIEGKKIIIGGKESIEYQKMISIIKQKINSKSLIIKFPQNLIYIIAKIANNILRISLPIEQIKSSHIDRNIDNNEAIKMLDYEPKSFETRLEESIQKYYDL
tara:strand:+ start:215 stop:1108 length:894 start_codon:yes stop_codon:yes gene_type:complete